MKKSFGDKYVYISFLIFCVLTAWWLLIQLGITDNDLNREIFSATYGVMALWGGLFGLFVSKKWGGVKSTLGKGVLMLSIGLLLQEFGQISYSVYYYLLNVDKVPYPSFGDLGYFGSIFFYISGAWFISSAIGIKYALAKMHNKILAVIIPLFAVLMSYFFFVQGVDSSSETILVQLLNIGYPIGQSIYVGIAMLGYLLSRKLLGGAMKNPLSLLLLSLMLQYCADFVFLYQTAQETWRVAGINEYMYLTTYFVTTISMVSLYKLSNINLSINSSKSNG